MIDFVKKKRASSSVLGLALTGDRLEGVVVRRSNGSLHPQPPFAATLALAPLSAAPELVGREIRNHLDQAGIRERHCAMAIPLNWALFLRVELPDLPEEDIESFLQIEIERGFPYSPDALFLSSSRFRGPDGKQHATVVAVPRNHILQLEQALKAAQLKPVSFSIGISALPGIEKEASRAMLALVLSESSVDLQVTCGGGLVVLRALDGVFETEGVQQHLSSELLAREIRITLGQLPSEFRETVKAVRVFGRGELVQDFLSEVAPRLKSAGLKVEPAKSYSPEEFGKKLPTQTLISPSLSVAAGYLAGIAPALEFLPPKVTAWQQISGRLSSKKLATAGAVAAAIVLLAAGGFLVQQWRLSSLQSRWDGMEATVQELEQFQQNIRQFRPWFDNSFRSLTILSKITEAFPQEGVVSLKTIEIRDPSTVTCAGVARDNQVFFAMRDKLEAYREVGNLKVGQTRGNPVEFTFSFQWMEGGVQ
jgi:hypothetical protein